MVFPSPSAPSSGASSSWTQGVGRQPRRMPLRREPLRLDRGQGRLLIGFLYDLRSVRHVRINDAAIQARIAVQRLRKLGEALLQIRRFWSRSVQARNGFWECKRLESKFWVLRRVPRQLLGRRKRQSSHRGRQRHFSPRSIFLRLQERSWWCVWMRIVRRLYARMSLRRGRQDVQLPVPSFSASRPFSASPSSLSKTASPSKPSS